MDAIELDTTLLRRGRNALSYTQMAEFAETVETRPIARLLEELPGIASLSSPKFTLAAKVLQRRLRHESPVEQAQLRVFAEEIASEAKDAEVARRIREMFEPLA